jgi:hypothetical protein
LNVAFGQTDNNDDGSGTVYHGWDNNDDSGEIFPQQLQQIVVNIKAEDRPAHLTSSLSSDEQRAAIIASCFLKDYEEGRPPTLSSDLDCITDQQLEMYHFKHSFHWKICSLMATLMLFLGNSSNRILTICLQMSSVLLFGVDLHMKYVFFQKTNHSHMSTMSIQSFRVPSPRRKIRAEQWLLHAVAAFLALFTIQSWAVFLFLDDLNLHWSTLIVSLFKPTVFFYQSRRARDALEALCRVGKKLLRVILVELFLILTFAAVACRLYANDDSFQNLARSWISLFACKYIRFVVQANIKTKDKGSDMIVLTFQCQQLSSIQGFGCLPTATRVTMPFSLSLSSLLVCFICIPWFYRLYFKCSFNLPQKCIDVPFLRRNSHCGWPFQR